MTGLLELRDQIKKFYTRNSVFIMPIIKFVLAILVLGQINAELGYMAKINNIAILLMVSLACSILPSGCILFFAIVFSLLHMYALSLEAALVGFCVYFVMFLLYLRFAPKDALVVALLPAMFMLKIPYIVPVIVGLVGGPMSAVSVVCGTVLYFFTHSVNASASAIMAMEKDSLGKIKLILDGIIHNQALLVTVIAFAITTMVVYLIKRLSVDYSWTIAMVSGAILNLVILLVGDIIYDTNLSVFGMILGAFLAVAAGKIVEFFRFCVDYGRTEKVQFEDDEYYYYVKAVPKITVSQSSKTVKKINTQRSVVTERTGRQSDVERRKTGRTVTVGNEYYDEDDDTTADSFEDDFEDLF